MALDPLNARLLAPSVPFVDPDTGNVSPTAQRWMQAISARTGDQVGISTGDVQSAVAAAAAAAAAAQTAADTAHAAVTAETTTRASADNTEASNRAAADAAETVARIAADSAETAARIAADALLAPKANPTFTGPISLPILFNAVNDAAAAAGGVAVGQLYRSGSICMQRIV
jgi:hypothetical protein